MDINYQITSIKQGYGDKVFWRGTLLVITPQKYHKSPKKVAQYVQYKWRKRLIELKKAGYVPVRKSFVFARNCPPAGVLTDKVAKACKLQKICPFCWGRRVTFNVFNRLNSTLFHGKKSRSKSANKIYFFVNIEKYDSLSVAIASAKANRKRELTALLDNNINYDGAAITTTIYPAKGKVEVRRFGCVQLPKHIQVVPETVSKKYVLYKTINKEELVAMTSNMTRYPVELLRCNPSVATEYLNALKRFRVNSFYGNMYNLESY
ncbi:hypothetical protein [Gimesia sp.]|uniref:hypothetical protein n=1 Tax=Gimesia sp. TaxID=2024833 RepID=UPI003A8FE0F5